MEIGDFLTVLILFLGIAIINACAVKDILEKIRKLEKLLRKNEMWQRNVAENA